MGNLSTWSAVDGSNNQTPPDGFPEGMAPSTVNNAARAVMGAVRRWYEDAEWINYGYTTTRANGATFIVSSATSTAVSWYEVGRRVRANSASGSVYGTVTEASISGSTTNVTVQFDSGSMTAALTSVDVGITRPVNSSSPISVSLSALQASLNTFIYDAEWIDYGFSTRSTVVNASKFKVTSSTSTAVTWFNVDRRIRIKDTAGTLYGFVTEASISGSSTNITVNLDSGSLSAAITAVDVGILTNVSTSSNYPGINAATQAQQEAATSDVVYVTPGQQHHHPSAAKGWVKFNGIGTVAISAGYNVTSITDNGTGNYSINWADDFSSADYAIVGSQSGGARIVRVDNNTAGISDLLVYTNLGAFQDADYVYIVGFGDH